MIAAGCTFCFRSILVHFTPYFSCSCLLPYSPDLNRILEHQWCSFQRDGANAVFMLQTLPGLSWEINFLHMVQRNVEVSHCMLFSRLCRLPYRADGQLPPHCACWQRYLEQAESATCSHSQSVILPEIEGLGASLR